ncbi:MAG TPA: sigma-70 family RNA polymerase sigma factor [Ktedonobacterales bacterium]|nr:sigma-70 family RNA polymerase sigma factor [Ktedonobacterales bacterium]
MATGIVVAEGADSEQAAKVQSESVKECAPVDESQSAKHQWVFEQIYEEYKTPITNYIYHLVYSRELAEDLAQDTFLKAFKALPNMDKSLKLSAWLYRIAMHTAYDWLRRKKLITFHSWQELDFEPAGTEIADPQEIVGDRELVYEALRRMPKQYRTALLLYQQDGFSYADIAKTLHIAESGVKMYLSRARQSFRQHYQALEQGGGNDQ